MTLGSWSSRWLLASCVTLGACSSGSGSTDTTTSPSKSTKKDAGSGSSSGNSGSGSSGSDTSSGSSGSSPTGDDDAATASDDATTAGDDGGTTTGDDGGTTFMPSGPGYVRGPAPTAASVLKAGPYQTKSYAADGTVRKTNAYDVTSAHIYYPVGATAPFAAVAIVPGYISPESSIANWGPFLASYGIVTMTIGTSNPMTGAGDTSVLPPVRGAALIDALTTIKGENTRSASPLSGHVDTSRLAVAGWSMGGGGTLIDANTHPELKAVMAMCAWNPQPGGQYPNDTVPTLMFGGTSDGLAGPPMPTDQYSTIPATTPKELFIVNNGSHYVANDPAGEGGVIGQFGLSWMKVFLEGDGRYKSFLLTKPSDAATFETTVQ